jgi:predicted DCC family thiol-disulfide oxidoreductase YuxK
MPTTANIAYGDKIILFDGVCNLCNNAINFVITHDKHKTFKFAPLQSAAGQLLIKERGIDTTQVDSIILVDVGSAYYIKSDAALKIAKNLDGAYSYLSYLKVFPFGLRNKVYDYIAKNRYKWYGKKDSCMMPTPELKSRFLDF